MRRKSVLAAFAAVWAIIFIVSGTGNGYIGGIGDSNEEYNCGGSCHSTQGTGTIEASASTLTPTVGQSLTMTVVVTANELGSAKIIGVFLVRVLQSSNSQPSVDGWTIQSDPNGAQFNYVEKVAAATGSPLEFTWTLKAPSTPGTYHLYARAHYGGGTEYFSDLSGGLAFTVSAAVAGKPEIDHQPPQNVRPGTQIPISATITNATSAMLSWRNSEMSSPTQIAMTNTSTQSGNGWIFEATIPAQPTPTQVNYAINATGSGGSFESTYTISVAEPTQRDGISWDEQIAWAMTATAILVMCSGVIIIIYVLFTRRLKKDR